MLDSSQSISKSKSGDEHPHLECGGPEGGLVFYSHHTDDGRLYEIIDADLNVIHTVTIDTLIESWEAQTAEQDAVA